jgi:MoxR-like ATPase
MTAGQVLNSVYIDEKVKDYIVQLVFATREPAKFGVDAKGLIEYGASPRATIYLTRAAKAHAFLKRRGYVTPDDVKSIGMDVLRHRIILTYEAEAEEVTTEEIVRRVFDKVPVP